MSRRAAATTFAACRSGIPCRRNTACGGATLAPCLCCFDRHNLDAPLRRAGSASDCIAPVSACRRSAMWGALARQGGATQRRHFVQCSDDQRDHGAWRVTRKGGRTVDRPDRAPRPSCGRDARSPGARSRHAGGDARAPGTHSRHAGATPALPAHILHTTAVMRARRPRSRRPQPSCGRDARAPGARSRHAGATPALPAPTAVMRARRPRSRHAHSHRSRHAGATPALPAPAAVMRARRPRTWHVHRAPHASTEMNFGLHSAEAGASCDTANPDCVHWTGSRGGAEARETCQFESS